MNIQEFEDNNEPEEISFNHVKNEAFRINFTPLTTNKKSSKDKRDTPSIKKHIPKQMENLFEEFFVFGSTKEDLSAAVQNKNYEEITLPAKILYSYPDPTENIKKFSNSFKCIIEICFLKFN